MVVQESVFLKIIMRSNERPRKSLLETKWTKTGLFLELKNTKIIEFTDPNTKERLVVFLTPFAPLNISKEYDTPEMMGWTAGVYVYFDEELKNI